MRRMHLSAAIALLLVALLLLPTVAGAPAKAPAIAKLLPASDEVKGWAAVPNTQKYCANPKELYKIYDGGDGEYIEAGVTEAIEGIYKNGTVIATVVVHKLGTDWKKSKALYTKRQAGLSKAKGYTAVQVKNAGCYGQTPGAQLFGYSWTGYYMVCYEFAKPDTTGAMQDFMKNVTTRCTRVLSPTTTK